MASFQVLHLCRALRQFLPQFLFGAVAAHGAMASTVAAAAPAGKVMIAWPTGGRGEFFIAGLGRASLTE
jgi:hypothetical protein